MESISPQILIPLKLGQENLSAFGGSMRSEANIIEHCWRLAAFSY